MPKRSDGAEVGAKKGAATKRHAQRQLASGHDALPLRTVAAQTGLTPDLIRAWEKRYAVVAPIRGARGARLYSSGDVDHLRLLARVVGSGRAIGDVASLSSAKLEALLAQPGLDGRRREGSAEDSPRADFTSQILDHLERFEYAAVSHLLGDAVVSLGVRKFIDEVVLPLLHRVGTRWADGALSIAEEHLLTGMLRNLLSGLSQGRRASGEPLLLATPAGERHEIGLLLVALLALETGSSVVYLGVDLPAADIVKAAIRTHARVVGLSLVTSENRARAIEEITAIQTALPKPCEIWLGGADSAAVAAGVKSFRGLVIDSLQTTQGEVKRIVVTGGGHVATGEAKP